MNGYFKEYMKRGLIFGGFGPIIASVVLFILQLSGIEIALNGMEVFVAVISTYILAFVHAGASVFNQIESWSIAKSIGFHFISLYIVYVVCYLINGWIPFSWGVVGIFTAIFVAAYTVIWLTVYIIVKNTSKRLNNSINNAIKNR